MLVGGQRAGILVAVARMQAEPAEATQHRRHFPDSLPPPTPGWSYFRDGGFAFEEPSLSPAPGLKHPALTQVTSVYMHIAPALVSW